MEEHHHSSLQNSKIFFSSTRHSIYNFQKDLLFLATFLRKISEDPTVIFAISRIRVNIVLVLVLSYVLKIENQIENSKILKMYTKNII